VQVGMVLAAVLFIKRIADSTQITRVDESSETEGEHHSVVGKQVPDDVQIFRIFGSFSFGVADRLETALKQTGGEPKIIILRMRKVLYMDATGLNALEDLYEKLHGKGRHLILVGPHAQPYAAMERHHLATAIGSDNICSDIDTALARARHLLVDD
jgi:SulP family sulfate permease